MRLNAGLIEDVKLVTLICRFMKLGPDSETPSWVILISPHGFDSISAATFLLMSLQSTLVAKIPALLPSKPNPIPRVARSTNLLLQNYISMNVILDVLKIRLVFELKKLLIYNSKFKSMIESNKKQDRKDHWSIVQPIGWI